MGCTSTEPTRFGEVNRFRLTEREKRRVEKYLYLVRYAVRKDWHKWWMRSFQNFDEAVQVGTIRLIQCVRHWDPRRKMKLPPRRAFPQWTYTYIRHYLRTVGKRGGLICRKGRGPLPFNVTSIYAKNGEVINGAMPRVTENQQRRVDAVEIIGQCLKSLPQHYREVIVRNFGLEGRTPESLAEIGRSKGRTREAMRLIRKRSMERMQAEARRLFGQVFGLDALTVK